MTTFSTEDVDERDQYVRLYGENHAALTELVAAYPLDYGCRPFAQRDEYERLFVPALASRRELEALADAGVETSTSVPVLSDETLADATVAQGDRFEDGTIAPQGAGTREKGALHELGRIMNVDEIGSAINALVNEYGLPTFTPPYGTAEGGSSTGGSVGPDIDPELYHVYFTAGVHARERGGPDCLIYFISDLLGAQRAGTGLTYGAKGYSNADVLKALDTGIVFFPLVNPDGVRWDQATNSRWRKNRNPADSDGTPDSVGVDINRNYDFLWDFRQKFAPPVAATSSLASDDPRSEKYHGRSPFSEPESRNVAWVYDQFPRLRWYMDIHSAAGQVLYSWGDDENQTVDQDMRFTNAAWDGQRGVLHVDDYREWISAEDLRNASGVATRVGAAMHGAGGRTYVPMQAVGLYATSGAGDDYAFSRFQVDPNRNKTYGYTLEFGHGNPPNFYPTVEEHQQNIVDVGAGLMEFCLAASDTGLR
jgi:murein tripeptide amidase MpaA